jgi:MoaA/NifB/PqqE/SkfB family radical SAM enzyme
MSEAAAYSSLKAAWHLDRISSLRLGQQIAPVELQFIISDLCNQDCYFCAYRSETGLSARRFVEWKDGRRNHNPNRMIHRAKAVEILEDAYSLGVRSVIFTGGGEPTVHPDHLMLFSYAMELGFECSLNTNGLLLRKGWEDVYPKFKYIRFSIDAGCAEDYAKVRNVPAHQYDTVMRNLEEVVEQCAPEGCVVGTGYVITPNNYEALIPGIRAIRDTGAAYVRLASMQSTLQARPFVDVMPEIEKLLEAAEYQGTKDFQVIDLFDLTLGKKAAEPFCGMQQFVLYIGGNLKVYRCCYTAYEDIGEIGDLSDQTFAEWFGSEKKEKAIGEFDARSCRVCPLEHKNETIRYMMDPKPLHVNFV